MIQRPGLAAIEKHFGMSFKDVIEKLHWHEERSILELSRACGISRDTFQKQAKRLGLSIRGTRETALLKNARGADHWAYGKRKENDPWAKMHSERMTASNPTHNLRSLRKAAKTRSEHFRRQPLPQEAEFCELLENLGVDFIFQHPLGQYIIDFFIPRIGLCIEIDSTYKWGHERKAHATRKDRLLKSRGFKMLRINKAHLKNRDDILSALRKSKVI